MSAALQRALAPLAGRIRLMIGRAVLSAIDDGTKAQSLQIELLADEVQDRVERFQNYGFTGHPFPGAEALVAFVGGTRSHAIVVAVEDRRYRVTALEEGEVAVYDDQGQKIILKRGGIEIVSPHKISVDAPEVEVTADVVTATSSDIRLGGAGGAKVARIGDDVNLSTGKIVSGSDKVTAL